MTAAVEKAPVALPPALPPEIFTQAVGQADLAICITDLKADIVYANDAFSRITGYAPDEVVGRNSSLLSNRTTPRRIYEEMWQKLAAGQAWSGRLLNRRRDGSLYLADLTITPVRNTSGATTHFLGMQRDITGLHQLECQVRNQKRLIESVLDAAPIVLALLDVNGRVLLDNQAGKKLVADLGFAEPAHQLLDALQPGWRDLLARQDPAVAFASREVRIERAPGGPRWFAGTAVLLGLHDEDAGNFFCAGQSGLLLIAGDISERRAEQERARTAALQALLAEEERVTSIRESLSAALFRLQEPLNVMDSAVRLLQKRDPVGADILLEALATSRSHIEALRQFIPEGNGEEKLGVNLNEVLRDVLTIATPALLAAGVVVDWQPAPLLPVIPGRPLPLRVLFKALLENAIEAMDIKGWQRRELAIATRLAGNCISVELADSGPGMPPEWRLRAFEPFFTTKGGAGGHLGTGLARAQQIVSEHGGFIDIGASASGGCLLTVEFPLGGDPL